MLDTTILTVVLGLCYSCTIPYLPYTKEVLYDEATEEWGYTIRSTIVGVHTVCLLYMKCYCMFNICGSAHCMFTYMWECTLMFTMHHCMFTIYVGCTLVCGSDEATEEWYTPYDP